jgi:hypothetical protein
MATVVWHGTQAQSAELLQVVARNCTCEQRVGMCITMCPPHKGLAEQRWLDGLLFMRSRRQELLQREMDLAA